MFIVYDPICEIKQKDEHDTQPNLFAGNSGTGIVLSLDSDDFQVHYKDGKASVTLSRNLTSEEARRLGTALVATANKNDEMFRQWTQDDQIVSYDDDGVCDQCDGTGVHLGK